MNGPDRQPYRQILQAGLLAIPVAPAVAADPNRSLFASLLAGQAAGFGCLPASLGLTPEALQQLLDDYFPGTPLPLVHRATPPIPELDDLYQLLVDHRAGQRPAELWVARLLASACAGSDHLWQDLGFASRDELSQLMAINFPALARANSGDMKWKKFLYRQFCSREGIYVCPAPSCNECKDYAKCFGPEN